MNITPGTLIKIRDDLTLNAYKCFDKTKQLIDISTYTGNQEIKDIMMLVSSMKPNNPDYVDSLNLYVLMPHYICWVWVDPNRTHMIEIIQ